MDGKNRWVAMDGHTYREAWAFGLSNRAVEKKSWEGTTTNKITKKILLNAEEGKSLDGGTAQKVLLCREKEGSMWMMYV